MEDDIFCYIINHHQISFLWEHCGLRISCGLGRRFDGHHMVFNKIVDLEAAVSCVISVNGGHRGVCTTILVGGSRHGLGVI